MAELISHRAGEFVRTRLLTDDTVGPPGIPAQALLHAQEYRATLASPCLASQTTAASDGMPGQRGGPELTFVFTVTYALVGHGKQRKGCVLHTVNDW